MKLFINVNLPSVFSVRCNLNTEMSEKTILYVIVEKKQTNCRKKEGVPMSEVFNTHFIIIILNGSTLYSKSLYEVCLILLHVSRTRIIFYNFLLVLVSYQTETYKWFQAIYRR